MSVGSFCLIKNENTWIGPHLLSWLPYLETMVFFDGNSTDGTLETIEHIRHYNPLGFRIILVKNRDPKDLKDDYVKMMNAMISMLDTDYAVFLHPDMIHLSGGEKLDKLKEHHAFTTTKISYAGEPKGQLYKIVTGRAEKWKDIMRLKRPDLGLHYFGHYGAQNEDTYLRSITDNAHIHYGPDIEKYPYEVHDSGVTMAHFSDVRHYGRRLSRMITCLMNQGHTKEQAEALAPNHPRVSLEDGMGFKFEKSEYPKEFKESLCLK